MIEELLKQLGDTQEEVRDTLIKENCKGWTHETCYCPVAKYLYRKSGKAVRVTRFKAYLEKEREIEYDLPQPVRDFITDFDLGDYPELQLGLK